MAKRLYYRIKEVADRVGEDASTIRYWEVEFPHIAPSTTPNGTRREKKLTISGARAELKSHRDKVELRSNTLTRLRSIHSQLLDLRHLLDEPTSSN